MVGMLSFLKHAEQLKNTMRQCWTSEGKQESVAEHTWRLCLMVMLFEKEFPSGVDTNKLMKMCLIHDLAELIDGDIPATVIDLNKAAKERKNLLILLKPLSEEMQKEFVDLFDEYEAATTVESKLSKALDKLETLMQHNTGINPVDFDYSFNLTYGKKYTDNFSFSQEIRKIVDVETNKNIK